MVQTESDLDSVEKETIVPYLSTSGWKLAHYVIQGNEWILKGTFSKTFNTMEEALEALQKL